VLSSEHASTQSKSFTLNKPIQETNPEESAGNLLEPGHPGIMTGIDNETTLKTPDNDTESHAVAIDKKSSKQTVEITQQSVSVIYKIRSNFASLVFIRYSCARISRWERQCFLSLVE
jgi:hypothetical protein